MNSAVRMTLGLRALRAVPQSRVQLVHVGLAHVGQLAAGNDVLFTPSQQFGFVQSGGSLAAFGRQALAAAWPGVTGETPNLAELQIAGSVANFESGYGTAKFNNQGTPVGNTNNWGAVMCKSTPPCDGVTCFEATDHGSNFISSDNPSGAFQACFKLFNTAAEGAAYFIRQITIVRPNSWAAMKAGDIDGFSLHMFNEHYYGGLPVNAPPSVRIANHAATVAKGVKQIASALGEPVAAFQGGAPASAGGLDVGDIALWSVALGTIAYGAFRIARRA